MKTIRLYFPALSGKFLCFNFPVKGPINSGFPVSTGQLSLAPYAERPLPSAQVAGEWNAISTITEGLPRKRQGPFSPAL